LKAELAIAELHYKKSEWDAARLAYEDFLRAHPRYAELDFVVFRLGMTLYQKAPVVAAKDQTWTRQAINTWTGFSSRFPNSAHGVEAEKFLTKARNRMGHKEILISRFYDRREAGPAVEGRSTRFLDQYPTSPDRPEALELLAVAYARQDKDAAPTLEKLKIEDPKAVSAAQRKVSAAAARHARQVARDLAKAKRQIKH
jgi:outer membrane protein assembly factor BamD